jgi:hypothetical protein
LPVYSGDGCRNPRHLVRQWRPLVAVHPRPERGVVGLVGSHLLADTQHELPGQVLRQPAVQRLDVAAAPVAVQLHEHFFPARRVDEPEVRHPHPVRQADRVRLLVQHPALHLRGEAVGEHPHLRRRVRAEVRQV